MEIWPATLAYVIRNLRRRREIRITASRISAPSAVDLAVAPCYAGAHRACLIGECVEAGEGCDNCFGRAGRCGQAGCELRSARNAGVK
jgi:hypothetical protein